MITNRESKMMRKEMTVAYFKVLSAWRYCGNSQTTSVRIASALADDQTMYFPYIS
jgi:hypothetical protein